MCELQDAFLKKRLLRTADLTLQKVIDSARASEVARAQRQMIDSPAERVEAASVAVPSSKSERFDVQGQSVGRCSRCDYKHGAQRCPALGKICHSCKEIRNFTSMCRTKKGRRCKPFYKKQKREERKLSIL